MVQHWGTSCFRIVLFQIVIKHVAQIVLAVSYTHLIRENFEIEFNSTSENLRNILRNKETTKTEKKDALMKLFDYSKEDKAIINGIICAILGYKFDVNKVFDVEIENSNISFSSDITNEEEIKESLQENADVYDVLQKIYNWFCLLYTSRCV